MNTASYTADLMNSGAYGGGGGRSYASAPTLVFVPQESHVRFVPIYNFAFHPASLVVERDTTVVWINESNVPHAVTFNNGMADSGIIYAGHAVSFTFTRVGAFNYHCRIHPFMHGRVTVTP